MGRRLASPILLGLIAGCSQPTGIRLHVSSDLDVPAELSQLRILIEPLDPPGTDDEGRPLGLDRTVALASPGELRDGTWPLPIVIGIEPFSGDASRRVRMRLEPTELTGSCALAPVERRQGFVAGQVLDVHLELTRECCGVPRPAHRPCAPGACVPIEEQPTLPDAGPVRDAGNDAPAGCASDDDRCEDGTEHVCDRAIGEIITTSCPFGCSNARPRCAPFIPSNVGPELFDEGAPDVELTTNGSIDTTECRAPFGVASLEPQVGVSTVCVVRTARFTVAAGATLRVTGQHPLVVLATRQVSIAGVIDASATGVSPGPGGASGGASSGSSGQGLRGGGRGRTSEERRDGGGGGGGLCGVGGYLVGGGQGGSGSTIGAGGAPGAELSGWELSPLAGGSGGGAGSGRRTGGTDNGGRGGAGGGAIQVSSWVSIALDGTILAGGGGGRGGTAYGPVVDGFTNWGAGGGGGSGGAVLLEAPIVTAGPSGAIGASGGGGGGSAGRNGTDIGNGGAGGDGGLRRPSGGTAGGPEYGATGGLGSGRPSSGTFGSSGRNGWQGAPNTNPDWGNGGGAGGSTGCVLVRTLDGALPAGLIDRSYPGVDPAIRALPLRTERCFGAGDGRYTLCSDARSWARAQNVCVGRGGQLAVVQGEAESQLIAGERARSGLGPAWIGLSDRLAEGAFEWVDGSALGPFAAWHAGEPNSDGDEDCVSAGQWATAPAEWNDVPCSLERPYVCEAVPQPHLAVAADDAFEVWINGVSVANVRADACEWLRVLPLEGAGPWAIGVRVEDRGAPAGFLLLARAMSSETASAAGMRVFVPPAPDGTPPPLWTARGFDDSSWAEAEEVASPVPTQWAQLAEGSTAQWVWAPGTPAPPVAYFRVEISP